jgi:hypothetical protein
LPKLDEFESITEIGVLTSNYGQTFDCVPIPTPTESQGTDEPELYALFRYALPLRRRWGIIEQNIVVFNFYKIKQNVIDTKGYNLESFISRKLAENAAVEYVFTSKEQNILHVWIVINKLDREARDKIYDIEYSILEKFRDNCFDFHVICRDDRYINDLFPSKAIMIYRRT